MKKAIRQLHLWLGLASGLVVFVVSLTGAMYVFEEEIRDLTQGHLLYAPPRPVGTPRLDLAQVLAVAARDFPEQKIKQVRFRHQPAHAATVLVTATEQAISLNPYTGAHLGTRHLPTDPMTVVQRLHTHLLLGEVGEQIVKWNVLIFFILLLSGLALWWPHNRRFLKDAFTLKFASRRKKLNYDLHRVGGFYAFLILLIVALTGLFWVFETVQKGVYAAAGAPMRHKEKVESGLAAGRVALPAQLAVAQAWQQYPGPVYTFVNLPQDEKAALRLVLRYPYRWVRAQNTLHYCQYTGRLLKADLYQQFNAADQLRVANYDLHTGRFFGLPGKILYFLAALFAASLPVTGFYIWRNKTVQSRKTAKRLQVA
jgi:uncharacterized iron-regulated membrane protein